MINAIGNILGGGSARTSYAKKLVKAYAARVIADGGVVEAADCLYRAIQELYLMNE